MRNLLLFIFSFYIVAPAYTQERETAESYYEFLLQQEIAVGSELAKLSNMLKTSSPQELTAQLYQLQQSIQAAIELVNESEAFQKSGYLKKSFLNYLETFEHLSRHDLVALLNLLSEKNVVPGDKHTAEDYYLKISNRICDAEEEWIDAKEKYFKKHKIERPQESFKFYLKEKH